MTPPIMNSINSVSTTRKKREAERSVNWTEEETQVLLCAWSDERVQKSLAENLRNRHVFKHLSTRMSEMGFCRSPHQCRLRVKTLKANYVRAKLQCGVDDSRPCGFKYFAEMDAVLGRRKTEGNALPFLISSTNASAKLCSSDRPGSQEQDLYSNLEVGGHRFDSMARAEKLGLAEKEVCLWSRLDSDIKTEDGDISTDEFELIDTEFSPKDQRHRPHPESGDQPQVIVSPVESCLRSAPSNAVPPPPPRGSPPLPHLDSSFSSSSLNSALRPLLETFQQLTSETRLLLEQLERQRQDQARWQQEVLREWLQREERRQREVAEREERQEKARMEHQVRVLELLTGLIRENGCKCGASATAVESKCGGSHVRNADRS